MLATSIALALCLAYSLGFIHGKLGEPPGPKLLP